MTRRLVPLGRTYYPDLNTETLNRKYVANQRDSIKRVLQDSAYATLATNQYWTVSDIGIWQGINSTHQGYAFVVRHMDGTGTPSATGHEWLFLYGLSTTGSSIGFSSMFRYTASGFQNYFRMSDNSTDALDNDNTQHFLIHYSSTSGLGTGNEYDMGFDSFANATYTNGDFTTVASNPYTSDATAIAFLNAANAAEPRGIAFNTSPFSTYHQSVLVFDDSQDHPTLAYYSTSGKFPMIRVFAMLGAFVDPHDPADTYKQGTWSMIITPTDVSQGTIQFYRVNCRNNAGTRGAYEPYDHGSFTIGNSPRESDDKYPWDSILLSSPTGDFKGEVHTDIARIIGGDNVQLYNLFDTPGGPIMKIDNRRAFMWVPSEGPWPPFRSFGREIF
jgi:hypothetical protein